MGKCPKCQSDIPESVFGLYSCGVCSAVLTVDMDGNGTIDQSLDHQEVLPEDSLVREIQEDYPDLAEQDKVAEDTVSIAPHFLPDRQADLSSADFKDVVRFAESPTSSATEGAFYYDVLLEGIDSEDLKNVVKEALRDSRFGWNSEEKIATIRRGTLLLDRLNPVKASLIISRLKSYPLTIVWSQNGVIESDI